MQIILGKAIHKMFTAGEKHLCTDLREKSYLVMGLTDFLLFWGYDQKPVHAKLFSITKKDNIEIYLV